MSCSIVRNSLKLTRPNKPEDTLYTVQIRALETFSVPVSLPAAVFAPATGPTRTHNCGRCMPKRSFSSLEALFSLILCSLRLADELWQREPAFEGQDSASSRLELLKRRGLRSQPNRLCQFLLDPLYKLVSSNLAARHPQSLECKDPTLEFGSTFVSIISWFREEVLRVANETLNVARA